MKFELYEIRGTGPFNIARDAKADTFTGLTAIFECRVVGLNAAYNLPVKKTEID